MPYNGDDLTLNRRRIYDAEASRQNGLIKRES